MSLSCCGNKILYTVLGTVGAYSFILLVLFIAYTVRKKKKKKHTKELRTSARGIEGRRNNVYEDDDVEQKDEEDNIRHERKRQDSGFIASSNESIIPFPDTYQGPPQRSPSLPNLPTRCNHERAVDENVFNSSVNLNDSVETLKNLKTSTNDLRKTKTVVSKSVATSTESLNDENNNNLKKMADLSATTSQKLNTVYIKPDIVVLEKNSFNCTGLDFGIGGIFVKDIDTNEINIKKGTLGIGDEVIAINDFPLNGLSDMEAFSFFAKSGPEVTLKIVKGGYLSKVEDASVSSHAYTFSELSTTELPNQVNTTIFNRDSDHINGKERLPRVIADANNLSLDTTNDGELNYRPRSCSHNGSFVTDRMTNYPPSVYSHSYDPITDASHIPILNRAVFMSTGYDHYRGPNGDLPHGVPQSRHSRHSSNENVRRGSTASLENHSRNSSNENMRLSRNTSFENVRHCHHSSDDDRTYHFNRAHSEETLKNIAYANGMVPRSSSGDNTTPLFTVESFARTPDGLSSDREAQLYYQELLRQTNGTVSIDDGNNVIGSLITEQYPQVTQALLADNMMVQRGYNNDYIVPITGVHNTKNIYTTKHQNRGRESSPSRRVPLQVTSPSQLNTRFPQVSIPPMSGNMLSSSPSSPSTLQPPFNQQQDLHRKRSSECDTLPSPFTNESVEIDADVMRYMTKKYSEPRFANGHRKDPPPYSAHTTLFNGVLGSVENSGASKPNVSLKRSATSVSETALRSRPHSMEGGMLNDENDVKNVYVSEKRKHPQRTHSLPAVKHLEMRPIAARTFLNQEPVGNGDSLEMAKKVSQKRLRQKQRIDSINRRKSIDSGTLRKLAEEIQVNPSLGGEYPIIAQLLGESQYSASERRAQALYRHKSTEALPNHF